jgi:hypothetical protein
MAIAQEITVQEIDAGITRARKYIETGLAQMEAASQADYMLGVLRVGYPADFEPRANPWLEALFFKAQTIG